MNDGSIALGAVQRLRSETRGVSMSFGCFPERSMRTTFVHAATGCGLPVQLTATAGTAKLDDTYAIACP